MLEFSRCKTVGVQKQGEERRVVSGVLEDELYAMSCEIVINRQNLAIEAVQARMKRFTTSRCPLAERVFESVQGWQIGPELESRMKKELGRNGCRHMAVLMVDCCRAFAWAELAEDYREALKKEPDLDKALYLQEYSAARPGLAEYLKLP